MDCRLGSGSLSLDENDSYYGNGWHYLMRTSTLRLPLYSTALFGNGAIMAALRLTFFLFAM